MADYPDWTSLAQIVGTDVKVAVDIQGGYIMLPVDIQAQNIDVEVDIVAQTVGNIAIDIAAQSVGDINVNIAASDITLNVNISGQDADIDVNISGQDADIDVNISASAVTLTVTVAGTADIDITAQSVGIKVEAVWQIEQGNIKLLRGTASNQAQNGTAQISYQVPVGKTLYIMHLSSRLKPNNVANYGSRLNCRTWAYFTPGTQYLFEQCTDGGSDADFSTPAKIEASYYFYATIANEAAFNSDLAVTAVGWEI